MDDFTDERLAKIEGLAKAYQATEAGWQLDDHLAAVNDFLDATRTDTVLSMCQRIREQAEEIERLTAAMTQMGDANERQYRHGHDDGAKNSRYWEERAEKAEARVRELESECDDLDEDRVFAIVWAMKAEGDQVEVRAAFLKELRESGELIRERDEARAEVDRLKALNRTHRSVMERCQSRLNWGDEADVVVIDLISIELKKAAAERVEAERGQG